MVSQNWRALYPFKSRFLDRGGGIRMHYIDEGAGEPVVMVHGNPSWSFYYRELAKDLSRDHRVIVPDHVGMGLSDKPGDDAYDHTLRTRVDDLDKLLDALGVTENITLVVHDWGGMIGTAWACRRSERVKRLVILNTWAFEFPAGLKMPWQIALARGPLGELLIRGLNVFARGAIASCVTRRRMPQEVAAGFLAPYDTWTSRRAVLRFVQDIPLSRSDRAFELMKWTGDNLSALAGRPALIAWGGKDFVFSKAFFDEWRRRLPQAETLYLPDVGHYVLEDGAEQIIPAVRSFLEKHPLTSAV